MQILIFLICLFLTGPGKLSAQEAFPEQMLMVGNNPAPEKVVPLSLAIPKSVALSPDLILPELSPEEAEGLFTRSGPFPEGEKVKIGVDRPLHIESPITGKSMVGTLNTLSDGTMVWTYRIRSTGAKGLRLHIENCNLGKEEQLIVFDPLKPEEGVGPFVNQGPHQNGEFYTPTLFAEDIVLEYVTGPLPTFPSFILTGVNHLASDGSSKPDKVLNCHNDITCFPGYAYRNAIGRMYFVEDSSGYVCSGSLLVDKNPNNFIPYFLTANHCIGTQVVANTLEVFWNYETASCNGVAPSLASLPKSVGSQLLSTRDLNTSDYCFLQLNQDPPVGTYFLGWNAGDNFVGTNTHGIHHPDGSFKRISFGYVSQDYNFSIDEGNYWIVNWNQGVTEGGSSGSPLMISGGVNDGQVIGTLSGGSGEDATLCTDPTARDFYGRFSRTFPFIQGWINTSAPLNSPTFTPSRTRTPTSTPTPSFTRTTTRTATFTGQPTPTRTPTPSLTPTATRSSTLTRTGTATTSPTITRTPTITPTPPTSSISDQIFQYSIKWYEPNYGIKELLMLIETIGSS